VPTPIQARRVDLWLVAGAIGLSAAGDFIALVALVLRANETQGKGIGVAAIFIALWAPIAILAGHVGLLIDRFETTRVLLWASIAQAAVAVALAFVSPFGPLLLLTALLGIGVAISQSAEFALIPAVSADRSLQSANGTIETARYIGFAVGPIVGGALTALGGVTLAMLIDAGTFVVIAAVAAALRVQRQPAPENDTPRRARDGVVFLLADRLLALAMAVATISLIFISISIPADVAYVQDVLEVSGIGYGLVMSAWTVGMVFGAKLISPRIATAALATAAFAAVVVQGVGVALAPIWLLYWVLLVCYVVGGAGHGVKNVAFRSLIHERIPAERHGRAFAAYNGLRNTAEILALVAGGVLVATIGARGTLFLAGAVSAVAGVVGLIALQRPRVAAVRQPASTGAEEASRSGY
jgi:MFS family permease